MVGDEVDGVAFGVEIVRLEVWAMVGLEVVGVGLDNIGYAVGLDVVGDEVDVVTVGIEVVGMEVGPMVGL